MNMSRSPIIRYVVAAILTVLSFFMWYYILSQQQKAHDSGEVSTDKLSSETYNTGGVYNYKDGNPYGSYFVGFEELTNSGVSSDDMTYIQDVLINFLMYNLKIYNGKISYVKDSFESDGINGTAISYGFKFGVNDGDIHTVNVTSDMISKKITIKIYNDKNSEQFNKTFKIYPAS